LVYDDLPAREVLSPAMLESKSEILVSVDVATEGATGAVGVKEETSGVIVGVGTTGVIGVSGVREAGVMAPPY
jgi:hypothetical protein